MKADTNRKSKVMVIVQLQKGLRFHPQNPQHPKGYEIVQ